MKKMFIFYFVVSLVSILPLIDVAPVPSKCSLSMAIADEAPEKDPCYKGKKNTPCSIYEVKDGVCDDVCVWETDKVTGKEINKECWLSCVNKEKSPTTSPSPAQPLNK
ncbi:hypothetical protein K1X76_00700 [bacterium]|nr:hypothetical protein [bacterium]